MCLPAKHNSISRGLMRGVLRSARWWSRIKVPGAWVVFTPVPTARKWIMEKHWPWGDYESCTALRMICGYTVNLPMLPLTIVTVLKREFHWIVGHVRNGIKDISQTVPVGTGIKTSILYRCILIILLAAGEGGRQVNHEPDGDYYGISNICPNVWQNMKWKKRRRP